MTTVRARFDGRVFIPETPVELPAGSVVEIPLPAAAPAPTPLTALAEIAHLFPDNPDHADGPRRAARPLPVRYAQTAMIFIDTGFSSPSCAPAMPFIRGRKHGPRRSGSRWL